MTFLAFWACSQKEEGESNPENNAPSETISSKSESKDKKQEEETKGEHESPPAYEEQKQPTYHAAAVEGAVIVSQNPNEAHYTYCYKCEKCGDVQDNVKHHQYSGGNLSTSYHCVKCKNTQRVKIEQEVQW